MGEKIPISEVKQENVSITHRPARKLYDGTNQGLAYSSPYQHRTDPAGLGWPILNQFPSTDITFQPGHAVAFRSSFGLNTGSFICLGWELLAGLTSGSWITVRVGGLR